MLSGAPSFIVALRCAVPEHLGPHCISSVGSVRAVAVKGQLEFRTARDAAAGKRGSRAGDASGGETVVGRAGAVVVEVLPFGLVRGLGLQFREGGSLEVPLV